MKAYKLLRIKKDGKLYPLFIDKTNETPLNVWMDAECHPTKGFAVRKGWHCCFKPIAPHLKTELASGEKRVWVECEVEDWESYDRPESQGGAWILAQRMKITKVISQEEVEKIVENNPNFEFECHISEEYKGKETDEWGSAFAYLGDVGVEYNFCIDGGNDCSAIYKMEYNRETESIETDYSTFIHYEIDFDNKCWIQKLRDTMYKVLIELHNL